MPRRDFILVTGTALAGAALARLPAQVSGQNLLQTKYPPGVRPVWSDGHGTGRNVFVHFKLNFTLNSLPATAHLHLFADTRYRLRVNGAIVGYGPAAFLVSHPEHDTHDIVALLRLGVNEITIEVNARGAISYQAEPSRGGFVAWGDARSATGDQFADFSTPGVWLARRSDAWAPGSPAFSFAQGPVEIVDLDRLPPGGHVVDPAAEGWHRPVSVPDPVPWGALTPRSVPMPDFDIWAPVKIATLAPLSSNQECASVHRHFPPSDRTTPPPARFFAYATWLHSLVDHLLELSLSPGHHWFNGESLVTEDGPRVLETRGRVRLRAGWNLLYGEVPVHSRSWGLIVAWPRQAGLRIAAYADGSTGTGDFLLSEAMPADVLHQHRGQPPAQATDLARLDGFLQPAAVTGATAFPSREVAWDEVIPRPVIEPTRFENLELPLGNGGEGLVVFDFGREFIGHVMFEIYAPAGGSVDVTNEELLRRDGSVRMFTRNPQINPVDRIQLRCGVNHWEGFHARGGRYVQLSVRSTGPATLRRIGLRNALVSVPATGTFESSDLVFNWTWQAGVETLKASLTDGWVDPWREQGLYIGDALVEYLAHRAWTRDNSHMVRALRMWARAQLPNGQLQAVVPSPHSRPHPDYTLLWITMLRDYAVYTGDVALVRELWPCVDRIWGSSLWRLGTRGLWDSEGQNVFGDWGATREATLGDANGILNAFRIGALAASADLASLCGETVRAAGFLQARDQVAEAYRTVLWDNAAESFAPGLHDGGFIATSAAHANALALLYGIAGPAQEAGALACVRRHLATAMEAPEKCTPRGGHYELYFLHFVLELLGNRDLHQEAEAVIRRFWGLQRDRGAWTLWEAFHRGLIGVESQCHGWSVGPNVYFHRTVLGIECTPDRVKIVPNAAGLTYARGIHPHPRGDIRVDWRIEGEAFKLDVDLPQGLAYEAHPGPAFARLQPAVRVHTRST